jgi:hypothetical protein
VSTCPCCGQPIEATLEDALNAVTPMMRSIVEFLSRRRGSVASGEEIADYVYRNYPDGGPATAGECIKVTIHRNRPRLQARGWTVKGSKGNIGGYSLQVIQ